MDCCCHYIELYNIRILSFSVILDDTLEFAKKRLAFYWYNQRQDLEHQPISQVGLKIKSVCVVFCQQQFGYFLDHKLAYFGMLTYIMLIYM